LAFELTLEFEVSVRTFHGIINYDMGLVKKFQKTGSFFEGQKRPKKARVSVFLVLEEIKVAGKKPFCPD